MSIDQPSKQHFEQQLDSSFVLTIGEQQETLKLVEVSAVNSDTTEEGRNEPFSVVFESQSPTVYEQGTYQLSCDKLGHLDIFLVPINADENSVQYEAVFT